MHKFSDFADRKAFDGEKIPISEVLNKDIVVRGFTVNQSKKKEGTQYISLQIELEGAKRLIFTGSSILRDQVATYQDKLPFQAVIKKVKDFYTFT